MTFLDILGYIIPSLLGAGGGLGIGYFINWKAARKKPKLENDSIKAETESTIVAAANANAQIALEELRALKEENMDMMQRNRDLRDELDTLRSERAVGTMIICRNTTCPLRNPEYGMGGKWFDSFDAGQISETVDNRPIEDIAEEKGYKLLRMKKREE